MNNQPGQPWIPHAPSRGLLLSHCYPGNSTITRWKAAQPEAQASSSTPAQCPGGHCSSSILLYSFCFLLGIQIPYLINCGSLFLGSLPPASSPASAVHSLLCHQSCLLVRLRSCLILQRVPTAHRTPTKSPSVGFPPGPTTSTEPCHPHSLLISILKHTCPLPQSPLANCHASFTAQPGSPPLQHILMQPRG